MNVLKHSRLTGTRRPDYFEFLHCIEQKMKTFRIQNLTFGYGTEPLFQDWSAHIPTGVVLLRCDESRGKTSLLRLFAGVLTPQAGQLSLDGITLEDTPEQYRASVFYIDPTTESFDQTTVKDFFGLCKEKYPAFDEDLLRALIEGLSLTPHLDKPLYMLSAGSKRKVWIAAALASKARLALIDDLTAALDRASIDFLSQQLARLAGNTADRTLIVAHYDTLASVPFTHVIDL